MFKKVRGLVSKKKFRYQEDGYDLDMTYITERVIAMGYPSEGREAKYRNPMKDVQRFFEDKHKDKFMIYNLCSERNYDASRFGGAKRWFPFNDHNPPELKVLHDICLDVHTFLEADPEHVVSIHCKAGKGRTGLVICCYLVFLGRTTDEALKFYGETRTADGQGVTIPSQRRYVRYYEEFLREFHKPGKEFNWRGQPKMLTKVVIHTIPSFDSDGGSDPYFKIKDQQGNRLADSRKIIDVVHYKPTAAKAILTGKFALRGDVMFQFIDHDTVGADDPMFRFWINTNFIKDNHLHLLKPVVDDARKDKKHKQFSDKFSVELFFDNLNEPDYTVMAKIQEQGQAKQGKQKKTRQTDGNLAGSVQEGLSALEWQSLLNAERQKVASLEERVQQLEQRVGELSA